MESQMLQGFREWETVTEEERELIFLAIQRELEDLETWEG